MMNELCEGGFVDDGLGVNPETGKEVHISRYRLRDNYARFYLKFVAPHRAEIERGVDCSKNPAGFDRTPLLPVVQKKIC